MPHKCSVRGAVWISSTFCIIESVFLFAAAYIDKSLVLPGADVGLLKHPGIFAVIFGDISVFVLATKCAQLSNKLAHKTPNKNHRLTRRYYMRYFLRPAFANNGTFFRIFYFMSFIGILCLISQTIKLLEPLYYYKHDTFDSIIHPYSFIVNRINLFVSWCIVIPLFFSYLLIYLYHTNVFTKKINRHQLLAFVVEHPDRCGGYSFVGNLNIFYMLGLLIAVIESMLLMYTHSKADTSNLLPIIAATIAFISLSYFSIYETTKSIRQLGANIKNRDYKRIRKNKDRMDTHYFITAYHVGLSPYSVPASFVIGTIRVLAVVPGVIRILQYSRMILD